MEQWLGSYSTCAAADSPTVPPSAGRFTYEHLGVLGPSLLSASQPVLSASRSYSTLLHESIVRCMSMSHVKQGQSMTRLWCQVHPFHSGKGARARRSRIERRCSSQKGLFVALDPSWSWSLARLPLPSAGPSPVTRQASLQAATRLLHTTGGADRLRLAHCCEAVVWSQRALSQTAYAHARVCK